jgi:hypothetical protein
MTLIFFTLNLFIKKVSKVHLASVFDLCKQIFETKKQSE